VIGERAERRTPNAKRRRKDKFTVTPAQMLAHLESERVKAETDLAIQRKINIERKRSLSASIQLADAGKESLFSK
jgi:hypothetical protein